MKLMLFVLAAGALIGGVSAAEPDAAQGPEGLVLTPPADGGIYHAAYPDFGNAEDRVEAEQIETFERLARKDIAWVYLSNNWWRGKIAFPADAVSEVVSADRLPFVRLMARSSWREGRDPNFPMQSFLDGDWDAELHDWCADAASTMDALGTPLLAEFGTEVNGDWFPWNGRWNGAGKKDGYGDPALADGPERFRDTYRKIVDICDSEGAEDITWFFHVDVGSWPRADWNTNLAGYYPGDDYIDWLGVSDYGLLEPNEGGVQTFRARMDRAYPKVAALSEDKPIAVLEYGYAEPRRDPAEKAEWIEAAIGDVASGRWPRIAGLSYWHEQWRNGDGSISNLHIDSSPRSLRTYRRGVADPAFVSEPEFAP